MALYVIYVQEEESSFYIFYTVVCAELAFSFTVVFTVLTFSPALGGCFAQ